MVTDLLVAGFKLSGVQVRNLNPLNCFVRNKNVSKISGLVSGKFLSMQHRFIAISALTKNQS